MSLLKGQSRAAGVHQEKGEGEAGVPREIICPVDEFPKSNGIGADAQVSQGASSPPPHLPIFLRGEGEVVTPSAGGQDLEEPTIPYEPKEQYPSDNKCSEVDEKANDIAIGYYQYGPQDSKESEEQVGDSRPEHLVQ